MNNSYHVTTHEDGKWQVIRSGNERATRVFEKKDEAVDFARDISSDKGTSVVVHNEKGRIESVEKMTHEEEQQHSDSIEKVVKPEMNTEVKRTYDEIQSDVNGSNMVINPMINEHNLNEPIVEQEVIKEKSLDELAQSTPSKKEKGFFKRLFSKLFS